MCHLNREIGPGEREKLYELDRSKSTSKGHKIYFPKYKLKIPLLENKGSRKSSFNAQLGS